jgi:hypothetical protein
MEFQFHEWACVDDLFGDQQCKWLSRPIRMSIIITMASTIIFARLTKRLAYEFGVSTNVSWVTKCAMLVPGPIIQSIVANGVFMLSESTRSMEPIDYRCVTS